MERIYTDTEELLSEITIYSKYARHLPKKNRRENWKEIIDRVQKMHIDKFPNLEAEIKNAFKLVREKKILPSMRSLQFAGKAIEINNARLFNCSFIPIDHYRSFGEICFLLLGGSGVGISVQKHHIEKLPPVKKPLKNKRFLIEDSISGWADSIHFLIKAYLRGNYKPNFDYREIRPKGTPLKTAGGKAPGPAPLKLCLTKIETLLENKKEGSQLTSVECLDICCFISDAILAGGIRRAALCTLFSYGDSDMLNCKSENWYELNPQRGRSNNSIVLMRSKIEKEQFLDIWKKIEINKSGEPGFFFTNDKDIGTNPCFEVVLKPLAMCNLVEVNVSNIESQEDLNERVKNATFIATLQASYTDFHFLRDTWKKQSEKEALIGVSLTGIADGEVLKYNLKESAKIVVEENKRISNLIGINFAYRNTTTKPSGTASIVLKTSSGIHSRFAPYYWRRMRINKIESLYTYLKINAEELLEDDERDSNLAIIKIVVKSPKNSIFRNETPIEFLERIKKVYTEWIIPGHIKGANKNNVSATIHIKDDEWKEVGEWLWENKNYYNGISVLPYDGGNYIQMPFEECTENDYLEFCNKLKNIKLDFDKIVEFEDDTNLQGEASCSSGQCEVK
jgi:ribonucleoside-triphosphate reductase (thioredoxin)